MIATGSGLQADLLPNREHSIIADGKTTSSQAKGKGKTAFLPWDFSGQKAEKRPIREADQPLQLAFSGAGAAGC